jgi:hypothetical protein
MSRRNMLGWFRLEKRPHQKPPRRPVPLMGHVKHNAYMLLTCVAFLWGCNTVADLFVTWLRGIR